MHASEIEQAYEEYARRVNDEIVNRRHFINVAKHPKVAEATHVMFFCAAGTIGRSRKKVRYLLGVAHADAMQRLNGLAWAEDVYFVRFGLADYIKRRSHFYPSILAQSTRYHERAVVTYGMFSTFDAGPLLVLDAQNAGIVCM